MNKILFSLFLSIAVVALPIIANAEIREGSFEINLHFEVIVK